MATPATMSGSLVINGTSKITGNSLGSSQTEQVQIGSSSFPTLNPQVSQAAASGSTGQCTEHYQVQVTMNSSAQQTVNLTSLTDGVGDAISFNNIKMLLVCVVSPDGSKKIRVGPQSVSSGWVGPWGTGNTASYSETTEFMMFSNTLATTAWTAGAGNYKLVLQEVVGTTTTAQILLWGNGT